MQFHLAFELFPIRPGLPGERILAATKSQKWPPSLHLLVMDSHTDFCLNIASWMHSCRGCAKQPKLYTLQSVTGFFLSFYVWGVVSTTIWMLSLTILHLSSTFIKQLEWQYLGVEPRETYDMKQLVFHWSHYWVSAWGTCGLWFRDHWGLSGFQKFSLIFPLFCVFARHCHLCKFRKNLRMSLGSIIRLLFQAIL